MSFFSPQILCTGAASNISLCTSVSIFRSPAATQKYCKKNPETAFLPLLFCHFGIFFLFFRMQTSLSDQPVVHFLILFSRNSAQEKSCCHCRGRSSCSTRAFCRNRCCSAYRHCSHHLMRIVICKAESSSCSLVLIVRLYGVFEAAGLADDRKGSVAEAHELGRVRMAQTGTASGRHRRMHRSCVTLHRNSRCLPKPSRRYFHAKWRNIFS